MKAGYKIALLGALAVLVLIIAITLFNSGPDESPTDPEGDGGGATVAKVTEPHDKPTISAKVDPPVTTAKPKSPAKTPVGGEPATAEPYPLDGDDSSILAAIGRDGTRTDTGGAGADVLAGRDRTTPKPPPVMTLGEQPAGSGGLAATSTSGGTAGRTDRSLDAPSIDPTDPTTTTTTRGESTSTGDATAEDFSSGEAPAGPGPGVIAAMGVDRPDGTPVDRGTRGGTDTTTPVDPTRSDTTLGSILPAIGVTGSTPADPRRTDRIGNSSESAPDPGDAADTGDVYAIQSGDTFASIATRFYGDERYWIDIRNANPDVDPRSLQLDQIVKLPPPSQVLGPRVAAADDRSSPTGPDDRAGRAYIVQTGDTLTGLAARFYGDSSLYDLIYEANRDALPSPDRLTVGDTLQIPERP